MKGFTLTELMLACAAVGLLAAVAVPVYNEQVERARRAQVIGDFGRLEVDLTRFRSNNDRFPDSLAELPQGPRVDPWGQNYQYLNIEAGGAGIAGLTRKDKNLVPINSDFDLYSKGPDGVSKPPLTA
jgi:general secretion pathway protein G